MRFLSTSWSGPYRFRFRGAPGGGAVSVATSGLLEIPRIDAGFSWEGSALEAGKIIPAWSPVATAAGAFGRVPLAVPYDVRVIEPFSAGRPARLETMGEGRPAPESMIARDVWLRHFTWMRMRDPVRGGLMPADVVPDRLFVHLFDPEPFALPTIDPSPDGVLPAIDAWHRAMERPVPVTLIVSRAQAPLWSKVDVPFDLDILETDEIYPAHHPGFAMARKLYPYGFGRLRYAWTGLETLISFLAAQARQPEAATMPLLLAGCRPDGIARVAPWSLIDRDHLGAPEGTLLVQGGLLTGKSAGETPIAHPRDRAWTFLTADDRREFLWFMNPGFTRDSSSPLFVSRYLPWVRRELGAGLRGERRFCIACNRCETHCPAGLDPQHLWKCLRKGFIEEAQSHGLSRCLECGLCSYACPSKIELAQDFRVARGKASRSGKGEGR
ncbi:4Fe-4S dicluster domain-containing protein [Myxococcota bacterium]|nr:4Fe-4S dicluster domain-containing protein [Myxococcota bacterium]